MPRYSFDVVRTSYGTCWVDRETKEEAAEFVASVAEELVCWDRTTISVKPTGILKGNYYSKTE